VMLRVLQQLEPMPIRYRFHSESASARDGGHSEISSAACPP
jgi:hypothetical protein